MHFTSFKQFSGTNNMRILNWALLAILFAASLSFTASAQAQTNFVEGLLGGDFSDDPDAPTDLGSLGVGISNISGQTGSGERDHVTFTIDAGFEITSLLITDFAPVAGAGSFLGLAEGDTVPGAADEFLFAGLVDVGETDAPLELLGGGGGSFGGSSVPATLGPGDYAFLFNEAGATTPIYAAQITVSQTVPEPSSAIVLAGLGMFAARRRRKN